MASRLGWGQNGGDTLGDVKAALGGRAFGSAALTYAISPAKTTVDASAGSEFTVKLPATSVVKFGNPINYDDGTELTFVLSGATSAVAPVWDTNYVLTAGSGANLTVPTGKTKIIAFKYISSKGKFMEMYRNSAVLTG